MNTFRIKAYAKINLGLDVLRRRPDGYHEVKMIMQTVDLYDDLEFTKLAEDEIRIFTDKEELPADQGNLIWRAAARMKELYQISEGVSVKLTKRIPIAAGMAGQMQRRPFMRWMRCFVSDFPWKKNRKSA